MSGSWRIGWVFLGLCLYGVMLGGAVAADAQEPHVRILDAAESFALAEAKQGLPNAKLRISASPLDARLALPACTQGLSAFKPSGGRVIGNAVIGVRCVGPHPWTLYVPVQVSARLAVVVAVRPLVRGTQLMASELALADHDLSNLAYGYLTGKTQAVGQVLTRDVMAGQVVLPAMLSPPILVRRGQMVTVMSGGSGIEVTTEGVALASGSRGQAIKVRNSHSQRIIEGVVSGPGQVTVGG